MSIVPEGPTTPQKSPHLLSELQSEVSVEAAPLLQLIVKYVWVIVTVLVVLIIALAGTAGYQWYTQRANSQEQAALANIVATTNGAQRISALEKFLGSAPDSIKNAALLSIADTAVSEKDYLAAANAYGRVAATDTSGAMGLMAALNQGQLLLRAGKAAEAVTVLEKVENSVPEAQRMLARQILAEAAVMAGNVTRAKTAFEALAAASRGSEADYYRYRLRTLQDAATPKTGGDGTPADTAKNTQ